MISIDHLIRKLEKERARLRRDEFNTTFMQGMIQGLSLAITIATELWDETKHQPCPNPTGAKRKEASHV